MKTIKNITIMKVKLFIPLILLLAAGCGTSSHVASNSDDIYYSSKDNVKKGVIDGQTEQLKAQTQKTVAEKTIYMDADRVYLSNPSTLKIEGTVDTVVYSGELADADSYERKLRMFDDPHYTVEIDMGYNYGWGYPYYGWDYPYYGSWGWHAGWYGGWYSPWYRPWGWGWGYPHYWYDSWYGGYFGGYYGGYYGGGWYNNPWHYDNRNYTYAAGRGSGLRYSGSSYARNSVRSSSDRTTRSSSSVQRSSNTVSRSSNVTRIDNTASGNVSRSSYNRNGATNNRGNSVDAYSTRSRISNQAGQNSSSRGTAATTTPRENTQVYTRPSTGRSSYNEGSRSSGNYIVPNRSSSSSSSSDDNSSTSRSRSSSSSSNTYSAPPSRSSSSSSNTYSAPPSRSSSSSSGSYSAPSRSSGSSGSYSAPSRSSSGGGGGVRSSGGGGSTRSSGGGRGR
jgi:hypothetical protein